jgi:Kef-type K+ transport system membrane component KefB
LSPTTLLLLQLIVVLVAARACGWVANRLGQPGVVGEMAAGVLLGCRRCPPSAWCCSCS